MFIYTVHDIITNHFCLLTNISIEKLRNLRKYRIHKMGYATFAISTIMHIHKVYSKTVSRVLSVLKKFGSKRCNSDSSKKLKIT